MESNEVLRALAKEAASIKTVKKEMKEKKNSSVNNIEFTLTLAEYPDFIITKKAPRSTKHLIVMPSAGTAFIKEEKKGGEVSSEILNGTNYQAFTAGMEDIKLPDGFWGKKVSRGKPMGDRIAEIMENKTLLTIIKKKILPESIDLLVVHGKWEHGEEKKYIAAYEQNPILSAEFCDLERAFELILKEPVLVSDITRSFGINNAREFLKEYERSLVNFFERNNGSYSYRTSTLNQYTRRDTKSFETPRRGNEELSVIPRTQMKFSSFMNYVLYESVRMGYGLNMWGFFQDWIDSLEMQYMLYDKIKEKYPEQLPVYHMQLSYKCALRKQEIDRRKFNMQSEKTAFYEGEYKGFVFIAPKCEQDFYDEATSQMNCLASYVSSFIDGRCMILFMRKKRTPEESYITVEIVNGAVQQAYRARNTRLSDEESDILRKWVDKCNNKEEREKEAV